MEPFCGPGIEMQGYGTQGQRVSEGTHTLQMTLLSGSDGAEDACPCEFHIAFYDKP
jgi:hypothetical protein